MKTLLIILTAATQNVILHAFTHVMTEICQVLSYLYLTLRASIFTNLDYRSFLSLFGCIGKLRGK